MAHGQTLQARVLVCSEFLVITLKQFEREKVRTYMNDSNGNKRERVGVGVIIMPAS